MKTFNYIYFFFLQAYFFYKMETQVMLLHKYLSKVHKYQISNIYAFFIIFFSPDLHFNGTFIIYLREILLQTTLYVLGDRKYSLHRKMSRHTH